MCVLMSCYVCLSMTGPWNSLSTQSLSPLKEALRKSRVRSPLHPERWSDWQPVIPASLMSIASSSRDAPVWYCPQYAPLKGSDTKNPYMHLI